jgi:hypothetical protein
MAFGQQAGPPATYRQLQELTSLLHDAGHADFRDARGPMGFTQRQSGGKFTRDEAAAFIDQLQDTPSGSATAADAAAKPADPPDPKPSRSVGIRAVPSERLAAELERRGWKVEAPPDPR